MVFYLLKYKGGQLMKSGNHRFLEARDPYVKIM